MLREGDVDFERNLIYFGRTKNRKLKVIPMNRAAREAVEWFLQNSKGKYLVSWPWGDRVGKTTVYDAFNRACREAEIENDRFPLDIAKLAKLLSKRVEARRPLVVSRR